MDNLQTPTLKDIFRLFQKSERKSRKTERLMKKGFKETERFMKERSKETDRRFQETERSIKESFRETERLMKEHSEETERSIKEGLKETERLMKERSEETDRKFQETGQMIKNVSKQQGELGNRLGEFVEHMVAPGVVRLFQAQGIEVHEVHSGVEVNRNGEGIEIDLLVINNDVLIVVECKSKLTMEHVDEHLKRMAKLKRLLPVYKNHRALGAVAAMVMSESVKNYAHSQGLYVLRQNGESVEIGNPAGFSPMAW